MGVRNVREDWRKRMEMLRYLARRAARDQGPPSVREVGEAAGLRSSQTAYYHLKKLEEAGYVERDGRKARGIRLTERGWEAAGHAPLLGRVAAGPGIEAIADEGGTSLAAELLVSPSGRRRYTVVATGDSMTGARIEEGDTLLVEENEDPPDGTVVLALIHGEKITVKRLYRDGNTVRLRWQNGEPREEVLPAEDVRIQGEVIRVIHPPGR
ncbi:transcriptional repressor LexA [Rubrobacter radiotolerans]|uniref:Transcriptional repressor LexA n=1 Tax=Rubrobacter radiotolerans TaxID=42256 RepID=A0AB35T5X9_RUBRA|nr:transcriptional repressor LexA [Rubrobacter radiotolerans]MDX5895284.1 transcriptional repressor LexA [Rubrobacter radiotolerans]SMC01976.1 repressor LexA [Rubrobacter radiotolerans DSM 5868]